MPSRSLSGWGAAAVLVAESILAPVSAQDATTPPSGAKLLEKSQNPISDLISVPFQFNFNGNVGALDRTQLLLNIQPVYPAKLNEAWNLIIRPIVPVIRNPVLVPGGDSQFGIGDLNPEIFFSPSTPDETSFGAVTWGVGPAFQFPTASGSTLGTGKWSAAPAGVVFVAKAPFAYGALIQNYFSFAGDSDRQSVNQFVLQPFANYNFGEGWSLGTAPVITANWNGNSRRWTLPLGGGLGKLTKIGEQPVLFVLRSYYNVLSPVNGPDWQVQAQITFLFPK